MRVEPIPVSARQVFVSVNPKAGARSGKPIVDRLVHLLRQHQFDVDIPQHLGALSERAAAAKANGSLRAVVAAGGDGTVSLVANQTPLGAPIAILPLGTENLLAKFLASPTDPAGVCRAIAEGLTIRLDAGQAGERLFLLMAGCGFDAEVVRRLHKERTGNISHLSYIKPILQAIRSYGYPMLRVYCEPVRADAGSGPHQAAEHSTSGTGQVIEASWVFVVNLPRYARGLSFVPEASGFDGLLDVCTFRHGSFASGLRYLSGVIRGRHAGWPDCRIVRTARLEVSSSSSVPVQLDGDPGGFLPLEFRSVPRRLRVVVPRHWLAAQGIDTGG